MRKILIGAAAVAAVLAAAYLAGPRVAVDTTLRFDPASIGADPQAHVEARERDVAALRPGLGSEIVWADPATRQKTPLSVIYLHGFSASKGEIRPVPERVAAALGANLFLTRLTGHGQDGAAMATASVNDWINDTAEALAIGRALGERVVVIATSTGASLATWALAQPALADKVAAIALVSPNFGAQAAGADLLAGPWGGTLARLVAGAERGFTPASDLQRRYWTTPYPIEAVLPMAASVELARAVAVEQLPVPALFLFCNADRTVKPERTRAVAARWGAPHRIIAIEAAGDANCHVIAGDAFSPQQTEPTVDAIVEWVQGLATRP